MKCRICGKYFIPKKEKVYQVAERPSAFTAKEVFDAIDCPRCGCQKVLKMRMAKVELVDGDSNG